MLFFFPSIAASTPAKQPAPVYTINFIYPNSEFSFVYPALRYCRSVQNVVHTHCLYLDLDF